jgi:hypothetical protein
MGEDSVSPRTEPVEKVRGPSILEHWPLMVALAVLLLTVLALLAVSLPRTQGHLVYALDDAYIHMAMAKNFARHGIWGVTPDGFTSTSSGPMWTLLLAGVYSLAGVNSASPFIMNLLSSCLVLFIAYAILRARGLAPRAILLALLAVILLTPLPALIFGGMEHTLQTALTLAAAFLAARILSGAEPRNERRLYFWLLSLAPLITSVRFEGMFFVFVVSVGFILRRQWRRGLLWGLLGLLPVAAYGVVSRLHGWPWLPTTVLLKSGLLHAGNPNLVIASLKHFGFINLLEGKHLVALVILVALLDLVARGRGKGRRAWSLERVMTGVFLGTGILHLAFARVGWFYRYEAYLVALGVLVVACRFGLLFTALVEPSAPNSHPRTLSDAAAVFVLAMALLFGLARGSMALKDIPQAATNEFEQQYQMATFIKRYYEHSTVALDDIGAVNFFADVHCLDLWGLATPRVAALRMRGDYGREEIAMLATDAGARIAIIHDLYFRDVGGMPPEWIGVGQWQIHNKVVGGSDTISIYALGPTEVGSLVVHMSEFSKEVPPDVIQSGLYMQHVRLSR